MTVNHDGHVAARVDAIAAHGSANGRGARLSFRNVDYVVVSYRIEVNGSVSNGIHTHMFVRCKLNSPRAIVRGYACRNSRMSKQ